MKSRIDSAGLVKYNANIRGKNVGDCVKRGVSLATGESYQQISKELVDTMKKTFKYPQDGDWRRPSVYEKVIEAHGGSKPKKIDGTYTLEEFVDNVLGDKGTFLVTTGHTPQGRTTHIVCVIDGNIYDSWNSKTQYAKEYYTFDNTKVERKAEVDVASMNYDEIQNMLDDMHYADRLREKASAMLGKKGYMDGMFSIKSIGVVNYKITTNCKVVFPSLGPDTKERIYSFKIDIVATPFETQESFKKLVDKAVDVRLYDRMYAVLQNEVKQREAAEIAQRAIQRDEQSAKRLNRNLYMDAVERKFFNTLPGWAQALVTYVSIRNPGQYHDSYEIYLVPLPDDPYNDGSDVLIFNGYTAPEIRKSIEHYGKTYEVVDPDDIF